MKRASSFFLISLLFFVFNPLTSSEATAQSQEKETYDYIFFQDMEFRSAGPTRGGRVTAVEGHPAHPHKFYMGGAGGSGVWKTENYGQTWINISDGQGFKSTSIGAIEVTESDTSIIYVGTGTDGIRSNVTSGRGVYKSTDAGESWSFMGLEEAGQIGAIEAHPENPDLVYLAALGHPFGNNPQRGVFRSKDGGESWEKVLFLSDSTGAIDLELSPDNPDEIYASVWRAERKPWTIISGAAEENGLYKSTDGGDSWEKMSNGLPQGLTGKANFAISQANPDRVYALLEARDEEEGLYRSEDRGQSWKLVSDNENIMTRPFYFTSITAHPKNPDKVYVGNVRYWVSEDGGETFERKPVTHADIHDLWINPEKPDIQVQGNDGGATVTLDGGETWSTQLNQPTAELYQVYTDDRFPYRLYAGQQDNTTIAVPSLPPYDSPAGSQGWWQTVGGCETGPAVPAANDSETVYANCKGRFGKYNVQTGQEKQYWVGAQYMYGRNPADLIYRFQRVSPIEISPHDSSVVYHGSQYVHRTDDGGATWEQISPDLTAFKPQFQMASGGPITRDITGEEHYSTLYSIRVSPHNPDVIWTGANDGPVHITRDGGETWTEITPENLPENGRVDAIEPSPHNQGTAYIAVHRRLLDDFDPYIYKTEDFGQSWTHLTPGDNGLPNGYPTRVVREDPNREGLLYAGTDWGLFASFDDGGSWQQIKNGLPNSPITDIRVTHNDLVLSTMGRGFWIMDNLSVLHQLSDNLNRNEHHLFTPDTAYRFDYDGGSYNSGSPEYPEPGAMIDFYLADTTSTPVLLEILDANGNRVRSFAATSGDDEDTDEGADDGANMMAPGPIPGTAGDLTIKQGHNRFIWNLRYPGRTISSDDNETYFGVGAGPTAVPGSYTVKLTIGDQTFEEPLTIAMDPRVKAEGVTMEDLQAQLELNKQIRDVIGRASKLSARIDTIRTKVEKASEEQPDDTNLQEALTSIDEVYSELETSEEGSYQPPMLIDQMEYLYYMTISADQRPGRDAYQRFYSLR
ncbi:MAG: glycosyl hydrolase [Balneolaceae bacterium]|nr:glycosyl hydrolase [Balneolaceae bacterium]